MHKDEIDERLRGRVEEVQSEGTSRIIRAIVGEGGGQEGAGGGKFGVLAPKIQNRLCKIESKSRGGLAPVLTPNGSGTYHSVSAFCLNSFQYSRESFRPHSSETLSTWPRDSQEGHI